MTVENKIQIYESVFVYVCMYIYIYMYVCVCVCVCVCFVLNYHMFLKIAYVTRTRVFLWICSGLEYQTLVRIQITDREGRN
jgi:hypothetical protein